MAAAAVLIIAAGAPLLLVAKSGHGHTRHKPSVAASAFTRRGMTISQELRSGSTSALQDAVALPADVTLDSATASSLASLGQVTFDTSTFHQTAPGSATIGATVTDSSSARHAWTVTLVRSGGEWKLVFSTAAGP